MTQDIERDARHSDILLNNRNRPGYFRINDIVLDVSPENIVVNTSDYNDTIFQARMAAPTTISSGLRKISIVVSFFIDFEGFYYPGNTGSGTSSKMKLIKKVSSLFIQARKTPIATIDNEKIRKELFGEIEKDISKRPTIGVVIDSISMMPAGDTPSLYRIVLNLSYFNYLPYVGNLEYIDLVAAQGGETSMRTDVAMVTSDEPGNLYTKFYLNGVTVPSPVSDLLTDHTLINNPSRIFNSVVNKDLTILYKEYWALTPDDVAKHLAGVMDFEAQGQVTKAEIENDVTYGKVRPGNFFKNRDGDTYYDKYGRPFRPGGIDTAETDGPNKSLAKKHTEMLKDKLQDNTYTYKKVGKDQYHRNIVDITLKDGKSLTEAMNEEGVPLYAGQVKSKNVGGKINTPQQRWKTNGGKFMQTDLYKDHGWTPVSNLYQSVNSDVVLCRYRSMVIPGSLIVDNESNSSGQLILENISVSLRPNSVTIPMQMYSTPTYQFMGGSSAMVRLVVFANPELDRDGMPYETSNKLAELQRIFHKQSENRIKFSSITKNDYVLIRHPIVSFLKYEPFKLYDGDIVPVKFLKKIKTGNDEEEIETWEDINYDDFFSCVSESRESETVNGLPFASRIQIDLREQKLNRKESIVTPINPQGKDSRKVDKTTRVVEIVNELARRNGIRYVPGKSDPLGVRPGLFEIRPGKTSEDIVHARRLLELANTTLFAVNDGDIEEQQENLLAYLVSYWANNPMSRAEFLETASKLRGIKISKEMEDSLTGRSGGPIGLRDKYERMSDVKLAKEWKDSPLLPSKIKSEIDKNDFLSGSTISEFLGALLSDATSNKDYWGARYLDMAGPIMKGNTVPPMDLYPDMMLPFGVGPTFYFNNNNLEALLKAGELSRLKHYIYDTESSTLGPFFYNQNSSKVIEGALNKTENSFIGSFGGTHAIPSATAADGLADKSLVNRDFDPMVRAIGAISSAGHMTTSVTGMDRSTPTFKIFLLHQDDFSVNRDITLADKSAEEARRIQTNVIELSDFYDLGCVAGFRLIKSEETPVDLLVIQIASPDFPVFNLPPNTMSPDEILDNVRRKTSIKKVSRMEERFAARGLSEGTKIQLRLGYNTDPNELSVEFNGRILSVTGEDVLEVVAVGDGYELVQELKGMDGSGDDVYKKHSNTPKLIRELLMNSPELVSFGRLNPKFMDLELPFIPGMFGGRTVTDNIFAPLLFTSILKGDEWEGDLQQWMFTTSLDGVGQLLKSAGIAGAIGGFAQLAKLSKYAPQSLTAIGRAVSATGGLIKNTVPKNFWLRVGTFPFRWGARTGFGLMSFTAKMSAKLAGRATMGVFAPNPVTLAALTILTVWDASSAAFGVFKKAFYGSPFAVRGMTIWDVLQELTLRHPGSICSVVPFGNRSTIFFGEPHQNYFFRPPTPEEIGLLSESRMYSGTEELDLAELSDQRLEKMEKIQNKYKTVDRVII
jgi:hypothetical protein